VKTSFLKQRGSARERSEGNGAVQLPHRNAGKKHILTDETYIDATDIHTRWNWRDGLSAFREDLTTHERPFSEEKGANAPDNHPTASTDWAQVVSL